MAKKAKSAGSGTLRFRLLPVRETSNDTQDSCCRARSHNQHVSDGSETSRRAAPSRLRLHGLRQKFSHLGLCRISLLSSQVSMLPSLLMDIQQEALQTRGTL